MVCNKLTVTLMMTLICTALAVKEKPSVNQKIENSVDVEELLLQIQAQNLHLQKRIEELELQNLNLVDNVERQNLDLIDRIEELESENTLNKIYTENISEIINVLGHNSGNDINIPTKINYTVSFTAFATEERTYEPDEIIIFDETIRNYGGFYSPDTGSFVCPETAYYLFSVTMAADTGYDAFGELQVGGESLVLAYATDNDQGHNSVVTKCDIGTQVFVRCAWNSVVYGEPGLAYSTLMGTLLFTE